MISRFIAIVVVGVSLVKVGSVEAADCNANGTDDTDDIAAGTSEDCNTNGVPDECDVVGESFRLEAGMSVMVSPAVPGPSHGATLAAGDLDGDLNLDLVVSHDDAGNGNEVSILFNAGDGTFQAAPNLVAGSRPEGVALGDLDGDLDLDLAVQNLFSGFVSVFLNRGDGTFPPATSVSPGPFPIALALGDLDADGDLDMIVTLRDAVPGLGDASVLLNDGMGSFVFGRYFTTGNGNYSPVLGDLDGDHDLDLAVANFAGNKVTVLLNQGNAEFGAPQDIPVSRPPFSLVAADLDGDGDLDLAATIPNSQAVSLLLNRGDGAFAPAQDVTVGDISISLGVGDLNGDLAPDLVATFAPCCPPAIELAVLLNDGGGGFTVSVVPVSDLSSPSFVVPADLDGDLELDVAIAGLHDVFVLLNRVSPPASADGNSNTIPDECEPDCNQNSTPDNLDIASGASEDRNANGIPDECEPPPATLLRRGDCDGDGQVRGVVTDAVFLLNFNFLGGTRPTCLAACDANGDGDVIGVVTDAVYLLTFNFLGGPPPGAPFPDCGAGTKADEALGCASPPPSCNPGG